MLSNQNANNKNSVSVAAKAVDPNGCHPLYLQSDFSTTTLLEMRKNICFYAQILDQFAPCLVLAKYWNNDMKMNLYCCTTDQKLWAQHVLSVSDEAFLILVLLNYSKRWFAEKSLDIQKVGANDDQLLLLKSLYKDSHHIISPTSEERHLERQ